MSHIFIRMWSSRFLISIVLGVLLLVQLEHVEGKKGKSKRKVITNQTVTPWEYCEGCKVTVDLYGHLAHKEMISMQNRGIKEGEVMNAEGIVGSMCDNEDFNHHYIPAMKWSCIKLTTENLTLFLDPWAGSTSAASIETKGNIYDIKREICVDRFKACHSEIFTKADIPLEDRSRCNACKLVASDLYAATTVANKKQSTLEIVENICTTLGYNHKPYSWLETFCDEMVEEHASEIVDSIVFRRKVKEAGQYPDKSLGDSICSELYDCDEEEFSSGEKNVHKTGQSRPKSKQRNDELR